MNHGHVVPNQDGSKARCGGPGLCDQCSTEKAQVDAAYKTANEAVREGLKQTVGANMTDKILPEIPEAAPKSELPFFKGADPQELLKGALEASGVDGFVGIFKMGDTYRIESMGLNLMEKAGAVKFLQTSIECKLVDLFPVPKKT